MKKTLIISVLSLSIFIVSCTTVEKEKSKAVIKANFHPAETMLYLKKVHDKSVRMIDSANLSTDTALTFSFNSKDYALYRIEVDGFYPLILVAKGGDTIRVRQTDDPAWPYNVAGNDECMLLVEYLEKLNRDQHKVDSLSKVFRNSKSHPDFVSIREKLNEEYIRIRDAHRQWAKDFVLEHPSSFAALVMVRGYFMEELTFHPVEDFAFLEIVANAVNRRMPENKYARDLNKQVDLQRESNAIEAAARERLARGKKVPEFSLKTIKGRMTGPQDYEGQELLIYFWAAGDALSRQVNPLIKEIYKAYNPLGLEVMAISFDLSGELWEAAIKLDSLPGIHIGDATGAQSSIQRLFNLKMQIPAYYLIDRDGRIYEKGRDFRELPQSVYDLFYEPEEY